VRHCCCYKTEFYCRGNVYWKIRKKINGCVRCEKWALTLREERRLRAFDYRVLRRIFGPKLDEVTGEWRKLSNKEFNDLYSSPNIFRVIKSRRT
jgi:hypothetical protein